MENIKLKSWVYILVQRNAVQNSNRDLHGDLSTGVPNAKRIFDRVQEAILHHVTKIVMRLALLWSSARFVKILTESDRNGRPYILQPVKQE